MKRALLVASLSHDGKKFENILLREGYAVFRVDTIEEGKLLVEQKYLFDRVSIGGCECSRDDAQHGPLFVTYKIGHGSQNGFFVRHIVEHA